MLAAPAIPLVDDFALVRQARGGAEHAFRELVVRYEDRIFRLAYRMLGDRGAAEDAAQETFLKVYRRLHSFRFSSSFYTWLYRIALNTATDHIEKHRRRPLPSEDPDALVRTGFDRGASDPERAAMQDELREVTRRVLAALPAKYRTILVLREYEGLSYDEMAASLGCALGTVESRLFRARARFREALERMYPGFVAGGPGRVESSEGRFGPWTR